MPERNDPGIGPVGFRAARNLRLFRKKRGLKVKELSAKLTDNGYRLTEDSIYKIEAAATDATSHPRRMTLDDAAALAEAFHVSVAAFFVDPECETCHGVPPEGFTCGTCGEKGVRR